MDTRTTVARVAASWLLSAAIGSAGAQTFSEGFDNVAALPASGWLQVNTGTPPRQPWAQGDNTSAFAAYQGAANSYASATFESSAAGAIDNWLISPVLTIAVASELSFFTRSAGAFADPPIFDVLEILFSAGSGSSLGGFALLGTIGIASPYPTSWQSFAYALPDVASGRFAFRQRGSYETSNYLGVDSVQVTLAVAPIPEPETWALMGAGLAALSFVGRRRAGGKRRQA